jgi:hypothetical protein
MIRSGHSGRSVELFGLDLTSPYDRFREISFVLPDSFAQLVFDDELILIQKDKPNKALSLHTFFRFKEIKAGRYDVLIFEKGFDGKTGVFTGIASGLQEKQSLPVDVFN